MPSAKDDASTDIESLTKSFAVDMTDACAVLRKARLGEAKKDTDKTPKDKKDGKKKDEKKAADPPEVSFALDPNPATKSRTPAEQAEQVVAGRSWVCWGAHMADKARHVIMKADGKVTWDAKKTMGDDFDAFKKKWAEVMKGKGLKNAKGGDGWYDGDSFHLEMADSKISKTDDRVKACLDEYARLSRKENKGKNEKFEKDYAGLLKEYLEKYEKKKEKK
jgi:hypothetical protein